MTTRHCEISSSSKQWNDVISSYQHGIVLADMIKDFHTVGERWNFDGWEAIDDSYFADVERVSSLYYKRKCCEHILPLAL